ncbi:MAG: hypothetical protein LBB98_03745 [Treponema sp.]|jgi:hypothetical protein|nr:hypothetical protein [Treponema sp.]
MRKKYHGTVYANGRAVYEDWYETRRKAVMDLKQEARETVLNSFDEAIHAAFTLSFGNTVIENQELPRRRYSVPVSPRYGLLPVRGIRIC